jgi:T5SS/PEP-CTERM-associated repeat protein
MLTSQFAVQQALAADKLWDNSRDGIVHGGVFSEPSNWFGGVPGEEDVARFETTNSNFFQQSYTVDFTTDVINQQLVVEDDGVTFNLMGHTHELTNPFVAAAIGTVQHQDRSGNLTVINGALTLPFRADLEIASVPDSKGALTVGAGGLINAKVGLPELKVGLNGKGTLTINSGGVVRAAAVTLGVNSGSTGTVEINSGGTLFALDVILGDSGGTVTVTGNGALLAVGGNLQFSGASSGKLRIKTGGAVSSADVTLDGNSELHLEGGRLSAFSISGDLARTFLWTSGTLSFSHFDDDLTVPNGGFLDSQSTSSVLGDLTLVPGATTRGFLSGQIDTGTFDADRIHVDEHMVLGGGTLVVSLLNSGELITPSPEAKYEIITTGLGISGSFANVANGQRLAVGHGSFVVNYGQGSPFKPTSVFLSSFQPSTPGDFDVDGDVDGNDFLVWQRGGSPNLGNAADLVAWRVNYGTSGAAAASSAVPESPAATLSIVAATAMLVFSGRRQPYARKP